MSLTFDAENHIYHFSGVRVPNVTSILENVGIIDYSHVPWEIREMALRRGTAVHLACQLDDESDLAEGDLSPKLRPYLKGWRKFLSDTGFKPSMIEHRGYCPTYRYAGTLDRAGRFGGKTNWLIDIKTNELPWWVRYQLAAYAQFLEHPRSHRRMAVALQPTETYKVEEFACKDWQADFNVFTWALGIYQTKVEHGQEIAA